MAFNPKIKIAAVLCAGLITFIATSAFAQKTKPAAAASKAPQEVRIPPPGPAEEPLFEEREFSDSRSDLELTVPRGWVVVEVPQLQKNDVSLILLDGPGTPAPNCRIVVRKPKQPDKITQAMINKIMHDKRNLDQIAKNLSSNGRKVLSVSKTAIRGANGIEAKVQVPGTSRRPDIVIFVNFFEVVGRAYSFECSVLGADADNMSDDIEALVKSARFIRA